MKYYRSEHYNQDAFRITVTTKFQKEDLKRFHLHENTVKRVLTALSGFVTKKNMNIYGKSLNQIANTANVCKESALKAIKFLEQMGFLRICKGSSRYANQYFFKPKESKVFHTKNGATLPFLTLTDYELLKSLNLSQKLSKTALSILPYVMIHAGKNSGFHASKKTICQYSGRDRRTLNKAYKELLEKNILTERPAFSFFKLAVNKGQKAFTLHRERLSDFKLQNTA